MTNTEQNRKSLALDRAAHQWLTEAADEAEITVKDALEKAVLWWSTVVEQMDVTPAELIESAVQVQEARNRLGELVRARRPARPEAELTDAEEIARKFASAETMDHGLQPEDPTPDLYSTDWERSDHTAAKVGPGAYRVVKKLSDETDRSAKECVEEAVQLWCIYREERRGERAASAVERIRRVLKDMGTL